MSCFNPLTARVNIDRLGNKSLQFMPPTASMELDKVDFDIGKFVHIPCGTCAGCRKDKARVWAVRCMHESSMHLVNSFITLTYNDDFYPKSGVIDKTVFVKFMKRLRKFLSIPVRYYHSAEYGDKTKRGHHHFLLFGYDFSVDRYPWGMSGDEIVYRSPSLEKLWSDPVTGKSFGNSLIGSVTYESCYYVAMYCIKLSEVRDGEPVPYSTMSRRPGIGTSYYDKYKDDMYNYDMLVLDNNNIMIPPKFYDKKFSSENYQKMLDIKDKRKLSMSHKLDTLQRLAQREQVVKANALRKRIESMEGL